MELRVTPLLPGLFGLRSSPVTPYHDDRQFLLLNCHSVPARRQRRSAGAVSCCCSCGPCRVMQLLQLRQRGVGCLVHADVEVPERDSSAPQQLFELLLQVVGVTSILLRRRLLLWRRLLLVLGMLVLHVGLNLRLQLLVEGSCFAWGSRCARCCRCFAAARACACACSSPLLILLGHVFLTEVLVKGHLVSMLLAYQQVQHMHFFAGSS